MPAGTDDEPGFATLGATIAEEIPFRAETRTSGVRTADGRARSSRAPSTRSRADLDGALPAEIVAATDRIADPGATPLALRERRPRRSA